ncbi:hypothetical protein ACE41H_17940 [Paenibacillus enshidis]|uniref:DUF3592 domain-containing protein n=1 Tax=Paenibacillus enshidis TaxID=1458439 RepID=A0ABV5AXC8_9BACL
MNSTTFIILLIIFGLITGSITLIVVLKSLRTNLKAQQSRQEILADGTQAKALIHSVQQTSSTMDGRPGIQLDLTVTQEDGQTFRTTVETFISVVDIPQYQNGAVIDVRYKMIGNERKVEVENAYIPSA